MGARAILTVRVRLTSWGIPGNRATVWNRCPTVTSTYGLPVKSVPLAVVTVTGFLVSATRFGASARAASRVVLYGDSARMYGSLSYMAPFRAQLARVVAR